MKKENFGKFVAAGLVIWLICVDIYIAGNAGSFVPRHLREYLFQEWTGNFGDWFGLILFHATTLGLAAGLIGWWEAYVDAKGIGLFIALWAGWLSGLLLIYA